MTTPNSSNPTNASGPIFNLGVWDTSLNPADLMIDENGQPFDTSLADDDGFNWQTTTYNPEAQDVVEGVENIRVPDECNFFLTAEGENYDQTQYTQPEYTLPQDDLTQYSYQGLTVQPQVTVYQDIHANDIQPYTPSPVERSFPEYEAEAIIVRQPMEPLRVTVPLGVWSGGLVGVPPIRALGVQPTVCTQRKQGEKPAEERTHLYTIYSPLAAWRSFKYTRRGYLHVSIRFTQETIVEFLYNHPLGNKLRLRIGRNLYDSKKRQTGTDDEVSCRAELCNEYSNNHIGSGELRVLIDEVTCRLPANETDDNDPYFGAGYLHLTCLEKLINITPLVIAGILVPEEGRNLPHEPPTVRKSGPKHNNKMALYPKQVKQFNAWKVAHQGDTCPAVGRETLSVYLWLAHQRYGRIGTRLPPGVTTSMVHTYLEQTKHDQGWGGQRAAGCTVQELNKMIAEGRQCEIVAPRNGPNGKKGMRTNGGPKNDKKRKASEQPEPLLDPELWAIMPAKGNKKQKTSDKKKQQQSGGAQGVYYEDVPMSVPKQTGRPGLRSNEAWEAPEQRSDSVYFDDMGPVLQHQNPTDSDNFVPGLQYPDLYIGYNKHGQQYQAPPDYGNQTQLPRQENFEFVAPRPQGIINPQYAARDVQQLQGLAVSNGASWVSQDASQNQATFNVYDEAQIDYSNENRVVAIDDNFTALLGDNFVFDPTNVPTYTTGLEGILAVNDNPAVAAKMEGSSSSCNGDYEIYEDGFGPDAKKTGFLDNYDDSNKENQPPEE